MQCQRAELSIGGLAPSAAFVTMRDQFETTLELSKALAPIDASALILLVFSTLAQPYRCSDSLRSAWLPCGPN